MLPGRPLALLATALLLLSGPALAQQPKADGGGGEARSGWYAGMGFKVGTNTFERSLERKLGFNISTNEVVGVDGRVGFRLHPNFASELQVEWLSPFRAAVDELCTSLRPLSDTLTLKEIEALYPGISEGGLDRLPCRGNPVIRLGDPIRIEPIVATLNGRAYLATGRWQPYLSFGSGLMYIEVRDTAPGAKDVQDVGFALRVGGGIEYYITEQLVLNLGASYVIPISGRAQEYDYVSIEPFGLTWRFE